MHYPNETIHPANRLEIARKTAGYSVQDGLDLILGVSRNTVTHYQTPGRVGRWNLEIILKWCLACEVRPSWIDPDLADHDLAFEAKMLDLKARGVTFAEDHIGFDPRRSDVTVPEERRDEPAFDFMRVMPGETSGRMYPFLPSLASAEGHHDIHLAECPTIPARKEVVS